MINIIDPYWWNLGPVPVRNEGLPRIDIGGIYKLSTNAVALTESSVDYGINPCLYSKLPCESIVLLTIHADAPTGGEDLPVLVGVPSGASTISSGDTTGKTKISVVDRYVYHMAKSDFFESSIISEQYLLQFVKDYLDDIDGYDGKALTRFYADCIGSGTPIMWEDMI